MLPEVLPHRSKQQLRTIVGSLRLGDIQVAPNALAVSLSFQVEEVTDQPQPQVELSAAELRQWEEQWQGLRAFDDQGVQVRSCRVGCSCETCATGPYDDDILHRSTPE